MDRFTVTSHLALPTSGKARYLLAVWIDRGQLNQEHQQDNAQASYQSFLSNNFRISSGYRTFTLFGNHVVNDCNGFVIFNASSGISTSLPELSVSMNLGILGQWLSSLNFPFWH
jgi:hypothetical protein